jgi:hypothetical protein
MTAASELDRRFTAMSVNLWNTQRWPDREAPLRMLLARSPDVLCVQELRPQLGEFIDAELPDHRRVVGDERGWTHEGNIWWDTRTLRACRAWGVTVRGDGTGPACVLGPPATPGCGP